MITSLLEKIWEAFLQQSIRNESAKFTAATSISEPQKYSPQRNPSLEKFL